MSVRTYFLTRIFVLAAILLAIIITTLQNPGTTTTATALLSR